MEDNSSIHKLTLPNGETIDIKTPTADDLPYQLRVYYENGVERAIPGDFRSPEGVHYGFDYFLDLDVYDAMEDIISRLKLSVEDQLQIVIALMNNLDIPAPQECPVVRAEIVDKRTGKAVVTTRDKSSG